MPALRHSPAGRASDGSDTGVQVRLLGTPEWQRTGGAPTRLSAKDAALLAKLAVDGAQARPKLCELIWPDSTPQKGYANLRSRASRLHLAAGVALVEIDADIRLGDGIAVDLLAIDNMPTTALLQAGPLLAGVDLGDLDELDRWLAAARQRVAQTCADALGRHAEALERQGSLQDALLPARRAVELVPLSETCWHRLMQLHYLRGDRAAAQETYWRCAALLRDELGTRPGTPMMELMQVVEAADRAPATRHRPIPASVLRPPTLIGRNGEWQAMWQAWQQQQPFLVVGDAGMGKSRLLEEYCHGQDGVVHECARPGDDHTPYGLLGRVATLIDARFRPALAQAQRVELARLSPEFGQAAAAPANVALIEQALEALIIGAMDNGLRAAVLDDLHFADAPTLALLRRMSARPALRALLLGLATRPSTAEAVMHELTCWTTDSHRLVRVDLTPLSASEVADLLVSLRVPGLDAPRFCDRVYRHAGGHPLYTLATLQAAFASGLDPAEAGLGLPSSIRSLLDARIEQIEQAAQPLLRVAAVAGPDLTVDRAARLIGCTVLDLAAPWGALEQADVLRGERFSHDLVREAALRTVPTGVRQALHRQFAQVLAEDGGANPSRLAWHWEQGERMAEAGRCWHEAARAAAAVALIEQQNALYLRAAHCHERGGEAALRFEALCSRLEGLQLRPGGAAVLDALPEVEALADTPRRQLRCTLARAEALLGLERHQEAEAEAARGVEAARRQPDLLADAEALHAQALVQCHRFDAALAASARAEAAAAALNDPYQQLRTLQALAFVRYATGQVEASLALQQAAVALAHEIGHRYEAAAGEGHVAALLAVQGDVPRAYEQARLAGRRQRDVGLDADGVLGSVNDRVLAASAAALGRFDEALEVMQRSVRVAGRQAAPGAAARAQLGLASLWLVFGRPDLARDGVGPALTDPEPARRAHAHLVLAQAAEMEGISAQRHWIAIAQVARAHPDLPLVRSLWWEWSYQGPASEVIERLQVVSRECQAMGLHGTARAFRWRELVRWLEVSGAAAISPAVELARQLEPHVGAAMGARCHPPLVWLALARAHERAGDLQRSRHCVGAAKAWLERALATVPLEHRRSFTEGNPLHRDLLGTPGP